MKMYNEFNKLEEGQKITLISFGEFGFLGMAHTTYHSCKPKKHYMNCPDDMLGVEIIHKPKSKRTHYRKTIDYNNSVLVYDGWIKIDIDKYMYNTIQKDKYKIQESKYPCFDSRYFEDILKDYNSPIIRINC